MTVGRDYTGIVEAIGPAVKFFRVGDRVFGLLHGCNPEQASDGAIAEYIVARADMAAVISESLMLQDAATLGVSIITIGQSLYQVLRLAAPSSTHRPTQLTTTMHPHLRRLNRGRHPGNTICQALRLHGSHYVLSTPARVPRPRARHRPEL